MNDLAETPSERYNAGMFNRIFKPALMIALFVFLWIAWSASTNGRYVYQPRTERDLAGSILGTRTGIVTMIIPSDNNILFVELHPRTGERIPRAMWTRRSPK